MAVVFPHRKLMAIPMPSKEHYELLDNICVTHILKRSDHDILILPHHKDSLYLLGNMGINIDGCDLFDWYYTPPTTRDGKTPWWWQLETANFLSQNPYAFVTSTPRTGKTLSTLMGMDFVQQQIGGSALIVAPLTVANKGEWYKTCKEWFPKKRVVLVHADRKNELQQSADVYLINPDGLKIVDNELADMVNRGVITIAIFDELTEFANPKSQRWIAANTIVSKCPYRWGLTGTPGKPEKIYGQVKLINPDQLRKMGVSSSFRWREMTEIKVSQFRWIPKQGHEETVKEAMSPCIRFDKEQLMEIPIPQVITEEVPLSKEQAELTQQLVDDLTAMVESEEIEATTASTLAQKMLQVAGGAVRSKDGTPVLIDATPKLNKLVEILHRTPRKKVVFSSFTAINDMLVEYIRGAGFTCEKIDGGVTGNKRSEILHDFLEAKDPHVLVCHPRTTAFGVELASADYIICYGTPMTGAFMYQQLFERLSSSRQTADETFVVHLSAGKQDKLSFAALASGVNIERNIVNLFTKNLSEWDNS